MNTSAAESQGIMNQHCWSIIWTDRKKNGWIKDKQNEKDERCIWIYQRKWVLLFGWIFKSRKPDRGISDWELYLHSELRRKGKIKLESFGNSQAPNTKDKIDIRTTHKWKWTQIKETWLRQHARLPHSIEKESEDMIKKHSFGNNETPNAKDKIDRRTTKQEQLISNLGNLTEAALPLLNWAGKWRQEA